MQLSLDSFRHFSCQAVKYCFLLWSVGQLLEFLFASTLKNQTQQWSLLKLPRREYTGCWSLIASLKEGACHLVPLPRGPTSFYPNSWLASGCLRMLDKWSHERGFGFVKIMPVGQMWIMVSLSVHWTWYFMKSSRYIIDPHGTLME